MDHPTAGNLYTETQKVTHLKIILISGINIWHSSLEHAAAQLSHYATSWKVPGSIPNGIIGFFN
jgi:hypothetical protein